MATIIVDPGHGGSTPIGSSTPYGTRGARGTIEKQLTMMLGRELGRQLSRYGHRTVLTRQLDRNVSLDDRARMARSLEPDAFVSLHFNAEPSGRQRGAEIFIHPSSDRSSRELAARIGDGLQQVSGASSRLYEADMAVLRPFSERERWRGESAQTSACLVEVDYLSNADVERRLREPEYLARIGGCLARAIHEHTARYGRSLAYHGDKPRYHYPSASSAYGTFARGIDVSHHRGEIDWSAVAADEQNITFAIIKASQGRSFADSQFARNWDGAKAAGLIRGAYHFIDPFRTSSQRDAPVTPEENVDNFISQLPNGRLEDDDLPPFLDLEGDRPTCGMALHGHEGRCLTKDEYDDDSTTERENVDRSNAWKYVLEMCDITKDKLGRIPVIYTSWRVLRRKLDETYSGTVGGVQRSLTEFPLWLVSYELPSVVDAGPPERKLVPDWDWTFWQIGSGGAISGISGGRNAVDIDLFRGTRAELVTWNEATHTNYLGTMAPMDVSQGLWR